ncbi:hypothetical protein AACH10_03460 [Ideonella sp. DXS22W]|uniref:Uncharacterized protein n=1 Tax=Pseudaquabacterium inlustre TaxID=2984192 RepID=A0ABU9CBN1_9BURK
MMRCVLNGAALAAIALLLPGCAATVVKALPTLDCPVAPELLQARCAAPAPLADGINYGQVLQIAQQDRKALADCGAREAALVQSVQACRQAIARYNQAVADSERAVNAPR